MSCSIPKNLFILFEPSCSNARLSSGWNITISKITPYVINDVSMKLSILKFKSELSIVAAIRSKIPFSNCKALVPFTNCRNLTAMNITNVISIMNIIKSYGLFNNVFIYAVISPSFIDNNSKFFSISSSYFYFINIIYSNDAHVPSSISPAIIAANTLTIILFFLFICFPSS